MNSLTFNGALGQDSEMKQAGSSNLLNFSVGNSTGYGDKKKTNWFRCALWGARGEKLLPMLKKGTKVMVTGELSQNTYTNKDGVEKTTLEVKVDNVDLLGSKKDAEPAADVPF